MLKHKPLLIAALGWLRNLRKILKIFGQFSREVFELGKAKDTQTFFQDADKQLAAVKKDEIVGKWRKYLQLKEVFYNSYTYWNGFYSSK